MRSVVVEKRVEKTEFTRGDLLRHNAKGWSMVILVQRWTPEIVYGTVVFTTKACPHDIGEFEEFQAAAFVEFKGTLEISN